MRRERFSGKELEHSSAEAVVVGCVSFRLRPIDWRTASSLEVDVSSVVVDDGCDAQFVVTQLMRTTETVLRDTVNAVLSAQAKAQIHGLYVFATARPEHAGQ